jgi:hypothetical protein
MYMYAKVHVCTSSVQVLTVRLMYTLIYYCSIQLGSVAQGTGNNDVLLTVHAIQSPLRRLPLCSVTLSAVSHVPLQACKR